MRFIQGHALVNFYHQLTHPQMVGIFVLSLLAWNFSGLVSRVASPPIILHPPSGADGIFPLLGFIFIFTRFVSNKLAFCKNLEDPAPFLRVNLSIIFFWSLRRRLWSFRKNFSLCKFPHKLLRFFFCPISWRYHVLFPGCWYPPTCLAAFSSGYFYPFLPDFLGGSPKFSERLLCSCEKCTRKPYTCLLFTSYLDWEGFDGLLPFSLTGFLV